MKTLSLLRHAKSSRDNPDLADDERPLAERGRAAAPLMGQYMADNGLCPDTVLCSPARRTRETLELLGGVAEGVPTRFAPDLYGGGPDALLAHLRSVEGGAGHVLLVGHNPAVENLAAMLTDQAASDRGAVDRLKKKYPTAALAVFTVPADSWPELAPGACALETFVRPKDT